MSNRFTNPNVQFLDNQGNVLAGGLLWFYVTGTSTPTDTYNNPDLAPGHANTNPIVLDAAGRAGDVFLDPSVTFKVVLETAATPPAHGTVIWTADPVVDLAANINAKVQVYAGNPNGNVAGNAGTVGGVGATMVWDTTNSVLYICTTTGSAAAAVWTSISALFTGDEDIRTNDHTVVAADNGRVQVANKGTAITFNLTAVSTLGSGFLLPVKNIGAGTLTIDPAGAELVEGAATISLTTYQGAILYCNGATWRVLVFYNGVLSADVPMGSRKFTGLAAGSASGDSVRYEQVVGKKTIWIPAGAMVSRTTNGPSRGTAEMATNKNMVSTLDYDATTQEFAQFDIRMPSSWNEGTVTFVPVWSHAATTVNFGVVWGLDAVAVSDDDAMDVAFGTAQTSTDTGGTTNDSYQGPESSAITIAGTPAAGDLVMFRIHRDPANGSDTMAIDARLHGIVLFYTTDAGVDA